MGFSLEYNQPDSIPAADIRTISDWVDGVKIIGETGLLDAERVLPEIESLGLAGIQFGDFSEAAAIARLPEEVLKIQETIVEQLTQLPDLASRFAARRELVDLFILDLGKNGIRWNELAQEDRRLLADLCGRFPTLLAIDMSAGDLQEMLAVIDPEGFQVKGGAEEKVGYKSFDDIDELFEAIEED